ncbi:cysteine proteinase [Metschnikowia bicuspidata var. bicuspidata NRRL YB-4993]|uniref:Ubiquitin carboxyl-terminal hydrolase n=1 Tax=Metschnikowia bicuspidata var. bicuspidata NRRL YB-4993 TaxID=869754 RepID=A0A1A0HC86_9ASCO|nr:cysteine proteinase [Metschnikowia bicuspidata var. bicuspidata NRRL YB-4993]OBA21605.1 cysteine proteinase [Metschnikowia bicuspidata var. bicuspidata NRRL YB-4993]
MPGSKRVIPLESNPEIFNGLAHKIGLSPVLLFHDVYSITDPDMLAFLPQPVFGIMMLFPITKLYEEYRKNQDAAVANDSKEVTWYKQTIGNGCGLYALLHLLSNLPLNFVVHDLILNKMLLLQINTDTPVEEAAVLVEQLEQSIQLDSNYGSQGQTEAPPAEDQVEFHFIAYIKGNDNHLYELDGRRSGPVDLGESVEGSHILDDAKLVEKIQFYVNITDESQRNNFAMMAIAPGL